MTSPSNLPNPNESARCEEDPADVTAERDRYRQALEVVADRLARAVDHARRIAGEHPLTIQLAQFECELRDLVADAPHDDSIDMEHLAGEMLAALAPYWHRQTSMTPMAAITKALAERDRYREALLRVFRDRREPDKVFAQVSTAVGFDALVETGLVRPLVRDGDRSAYVEAPASNQKEVGG